MKSIQYNTYGGPDVLKVNTAAPKPATAPGQILVEIHAVSINPFDWKLRSGMMKEMIPLQFPFTIGGDYAGVVTEVGEGVTDFKVGDEVYGSASKMNGSSGANAEFASANIANSALKPKNVSVTEAAALPLVGASALQALETHIQLQPGQRVLIHGGAGGIGTMAIQIAKTLGAHVATTVRGDDKDFVKSLGADEVIDYKTEKFEEVLKDFDAVFDTAGGDSTTKSFKVLKKGGVLVSMVGEPNKELAEQYGVTVVGQSTKTTKERLERLAGLVESGKVKPQIDKVFPFEQVKEAYQYQENSHPRGKVVITIKE